MRTFQEIKEDYAIEQNYIDWNELIYSNDDPDYVDKCNDDISNIWANEVAKQALINASKHFDINCNKQVILNESNIPKL